MVAEDGKPYTRMGAELGKGIFWVSDPWYMGRMRLAETIRLVGRKPKRDLLLRVVQPLWSGLPVPMPDFFEDTDEVPVGVWDHPLLALPQDVYAKRPGETGNQFAWRMLMVMNTLGLMDYGSERVPVRWGALSGYVPSDDNAVEASFCWHTAEADLADSEKGHCAWLEAVRRDTLDDCIQVWGKRVLRGAGSVPERVTVDYDAAFDRGTSDVLSADAEQVSMVLSACNGVRLGRSDSGDEREQGRSILSWLFENEPHFRDELQGQAQPDVVGWAREWQGSSRDYLTYLVESGIDPSAKKGLRLLDEIIGGGTPAAA